ncbi:hypothetical protein HOK51_05315 [Candidatus Woesearchaeota archaeon]|jgi:hypothetical protein|nr:hypothetical protein [archaeon]MBT6519247.1 hypothetical protein [Candidatus Woesearchaeota archaeon]MBT4022310.1 hypothetical protein [archaeon]MBT4271723.1 hypothetical protein [archaeon]MBT4460363.1 hypothetical protein [archaeon]
MKKAVFILLIVIGLFMTACDKDKCETHSDCKYHESCEDGKCENTDCSGKCPGTDNPCTFHICSGQTNYKCEVRNNGLPTGSCQGSVPDKECKRYTCDNGACIETDDRDCISRKEYDARQIPCSDGTETGFCSKVNPGKYCDEGKLVGGEYEELCLEDLANDEEQKKEAPKLQPDPCGDLPHGDCSLDQEGYICNNGELEEDESCLPITECEDNTLIGECSNTKEGQRCNNEGVLELDETCLLDEPVALEGCGETAEGDCSSDGKWCIHNELMVDEACENACDDGTPDFGCSQHSIGYVCNNKELVEDLPTCDPNYVYVPQDCDDGTPDGECTAAQDGYWCNQGVLEYDESCYVNYDECSDATLSGMCSEITPGQICYYGTLSEDDVCLEGKRCSDWTPNQECSKMTSGYFCNEGALQEDQFC